MKFLFILYVFILSNSILLQAQSVFPTIDQKPVWEVFQNQLHSQFYYTLVMQIEKDTNMCGVQYNKVIATYKENNPDTLLIGFYREEGSKVLFRIFDEPCEAFEEYLIYDFDAQIGDTLAVGWNQLAVVIKRQNFRYGNIDYNAIGVLHFHPDYPLSSGEEWWIKGMGGSGYPFLQAFCPLYSCYESSYLTCMRANNKVLFSFGYEGCQYDTLSTSINDFGPFEQHFQLSPNPLAIGSTMELQYQFQQPISGNINIVNVLGQVLHQQSFEPGAAAGTSVLDWSPTVRGVYWLVWQGEGGERATLQFVVQ